MVFTEFDASVRAREMKEKTKGQSLDARWLLCEYVSIYECVSVSQPVWLQLDAGIVSKTTLQLGQSKDCLCDAQFRRDEQRRRRRRQQREMNKSWIQKILRAQWLIPRRKGEMSSFHFQALSMRLHIEPPKRIHIHNWHGWRKEKPKIMLFLFYCCLLDIQPKSYYLVLFSCFAMFTFVYNLIIHYSLNRLFWAGIQIEIVIFLIFNLNVKPLNLNLLSLAAGTLAQFCMILLFFFFFFFFRVELNIKNDVYDEIQIKPHRPNNRNKSENEINWTHSHKILRRCIFTVN